MATLKNTTISDTGNLQLPIGTTGQRPSPVAGQFRYNTTTGGVEVYTANANIWQPAAARGVRAAGGTVYDVDVEGTTYRVHVFNATGNSTFTVTRPGTVEYLIVAGGGSGGSGEANPAGDSPGGGGAGGLLAGFTTVTPQAYTITVGAGASTRVTGTSQAGLAGQNSSAFGLTAIGGGAGGREEAAGGSGGSGGGGGGSCISGRKAGGAGTAGQGNAGGTGGDSGCSRRAGAGGGGAGINGGDDRGNLGGNGGNGLQLNITGLNVYYAGGGGGGNSANVSGTPGAGGLGGGGRGGESTGASGSPSGAGTDGTPNTGGGGGGTGSGTSVINGLGGSGIVVIRYPLQSEPDVAQPKVAGDGVVLDLDFAKPTVYSGSGTVVADSRLNGLTGTLVNSPSNLNQRTHRSSFNFVSSSNQYINAGNINLQQNFTLEIWFFRAADVDNSLFGQGGFVQNQGMHILYSIGSRGMLYGLFGNDNDYQNNYRPGTNAWFHWVFTYNHSTFVKQFYANSVLQTPGASVQAQYAGSGQFNIGATYSSAQSPTNGQIGLARVYNQVLTATEVSNNFNATRWRFGV
jgi:hypothetical protein